MSRLDRILGYKELHESGRDIWKCLLAEFVGTLFLVTVGCGSGVDWSEKSKPKEPNIVQIALCAGIAVATLIKCICHISGGHLNPAVTCGMLVTGKFSLLKTLLYIISQVLGAIVGAGILKALTPDDMQNNLGQTLVNPRLNPVQGFGVEFLITFVLVFTVFAVCDSNRTDLKGSAPLAIGLAVLTCHMFALPYTGSSMNSARSIGPAVITGDWEHHWVYWLGPCIGGMTAGILYQSAFAAKMPDEGKDGVYFMQLKQRDGVAAEKEGATKGLMPGDTCC
uniref:Aquaporin AQPAe.a n=1 Tax=Scolopendra viridis TaxID=118503 RepID=A0A4D5RAH5_SCOVI